MCVALPVADAAARSFGSRPLARPMHGRDVKTLQQLLTRWGLPTPADGQFGRHTTRRVRSWERHSQRRVNGRVSISEALALRQSVANGERLAGTVHSTTDDDIETTLMKPGAPR